MAESQLPPPTDGDQNRGADVTAVSVVLLVALTIVIFLRAYVRVIIVPYSLSWDDYSIGGAWLANIAALVVNVLAVRNGYGRHEYYLSKEQILSATEWSDIGQPINVVANLLVKFSICMFVLRIIRGTHKAFTRGLKVLIILLFLVNTVLFLSFFFECSPISKIWDPTTPGSCIPAGAVIGLAYLSAVFSVITDVACAAMPMYFLRSLQISRSRKISLCALTGLGLLTAVVGILKCVYLGAIRVTVDFTWASVNVTLCAIIEATAGAFIATLPTLKPLFSKPSRASRDSRTYSARGYRVNLNSFTRLKNDRAEQGTRSSVGNDQKDGIPAPGLAILKSTKIEATFQGPEDSDRELLHGRDGWSAGQGLR